MSKKDQKIAATEAEIPVISTDELQARIRELEERVRAGEQAAMDRVCKALNINPNEIAEKERARKSHEPEPMCKMWVHYPVRVNMKVYIGDTTVPLSTARVIQQALGDRRQRILAESIGSVYALKEINSGQFAPRLVSQTTIEGDQAGPIGGRIA